MNSILLLTRLQVRQSLGGVRAAIEKRTGASGAMAGTAILVLCALGGVGYLGYAAYGLLGGSGMGPALYNMLFLGCGALTFTFSLPAVLSSFFGSSDINDLLPLPVTPLSVVLSKALGSLATAYFWTFLLIAGPLAGWGIAAGAGPSFWVAYLLAVVFAPWTPVGYAGTLSILIASVFKRIRRRDAITTLTTVIALAISVGSYFAINSINRDVGVQDLLGGMNATVGGALVVFPAYGFATSALAQGDLAGMGLFALLSLAAFALFVVVARVLYLRIVTSLSSGGGTAAAYDGSGAQRQSPVLGALVTTELRRIVRNSSVLLNFVAYPLIITPVIFGALIVSDSMGSMFDALAQVEGIAAFGTGIALSIVMVFTTFIMSSNRIAATAISREGSNWIHLKYIPVPMTTQLLAKTIPGFIESALITLLLMGVFGFMLVTRLGMSAVAIVSGLVTMLAAAWLMACWSTLIGCRHPRVEWGNDGEVNTRSLGGGISELRVMLVGLVYAALPLLVSPLVGLDPVVFMPLIAVAGVGVAAALGRVLLARAAKRIQAFE